MEVLPLVSIVMPSMNQAPYIEVAIDSVLRQEYLHVELIVADGGSTDGTLHILEEIASRDKRLRWRSEPDTGPADALNKALLLARGTVVGWLNSDDVYTPHAVHRAVTAMRQHPEWLMVYGHGEHVDAQGAFLEPYPTKPPVVPLHQFAHGCFICQPTVFFKRSMWVVLGPFNTALMTAFDFDYWLRAFSLLPGRIGFVDALQAKSRLHSGGITLRQRRMVILEGMQLLFKYVGHAPKEWLLTYINEVVQSKREDFAEGDRAQHFDAMLHAAKAWMQTEDVQRVSLVLHSLKAEGMGSNNASA